MTVPKFTKKIQIIAEKLETVQEKQIVSQWSKELSVSHSLKSKTNLNFRRNVLYPKSICKQWKVSCLLGISCYALFCVKDISMWCKEWKLIGRWDLTQLCWCRTIGNTTDWVKTTNTFILSASTGFLKSSPFFLFLCGCSFVWLVSNFQLFWRSAMAYFANEDKGQTVTAIYFETFKGLEGFNIGSRTQRKKNIYVPEYILFIFSFNS